MTSKKLIGKGKWYFKENKERLQKWLVIDTKDYLKKKKIRKENKQEVSTRICLQKKSKK